MKTKLISLILSIMILLFLYCFLSPTQYFPVTNYIKSLLLSSDFIRNAPDKNLATYYHYFSGDRGEPPNYSIYYCEDKSTFNELKIKLHQYANSRRTLIAVDEKTYKNKYNKNLFISIHEFTKDKQECMSLSEYEYTYD